VNDAEQRFGYQAYGRCAESPSKKPRDRLVSHFTGGDERLERHTGAGDGRQQTIPGDAAERCRNSED
jgi:hypothetical protein